VKDVEVSNGLLTIRLARIVPDHQKRRSYLWPIYLWDYFLVSSNLGGPVTKQGCPLFWCML
jgi:hypothetical protein